MKIAILGFGREGQAVLKFVKKSPQYKKAGVSVLDRNPKIVSSIKNQVSGMETGKKYLKNLSKFDIIFRSPGIPYNLTQIQKAVKKGVEFSSATKLFFDNFKGRIIGITGTKGKGTTATLLYKILKACRRPVYLAGNIGKPIIETPPKSKRDTIVILELSSFQLQDLKKSPQIAVVLDVFPDHLDAHKNFSEYVNAKANIAKYQKKSNKIFYFSDNKYCRSIAQKSHAKKIPVSVRNFKLFNPELKIPGFHNFKNAVMAANVALSLGCPKEKIVKVIKKFKGNEHRLELAKSIKISTKKHSDILKNVRMSFYNDSASTNPQTATAAIKSFAEPKILICGGKDKRLDYSPLAKALKNSNTKLVVLFGENKNKIKKAISRSGIPIKIVNNLKQAVDTAYHSAKSYVSNLKSVIVVFSPASTSFDMFENYADRGRQFKTLVNSL